MNTKVIQRLRALVPDEMPLEGTRVVGAADLRALLDLLPTGDYVLVRDMEDIQSHNYGHGVFATYDAVKRFSTDEDTGSPQTEFRICECGEKQRPSGSFDGCFCTQCNLYVSTAARGYGRPINSSATQEVPHE